MYLNFIRTLGRSEPEILKFSIMESIGYFIMFFNKYNICISAHQHYYFASIIDDTLTDDITTSIIRDKGRHFIDFRTDKYEDYLPIDISWKKLLINLMNIVPNGEPF